MRGIGKTIALAALAALVGGCSLALDLEALNKGTKDTDTGTDTGPPCAGDEDCDDGIDCTSDTCLEDGSCYHVPDNDLCEELEWCTLDEGCVPIDDECFLPQHSDDEIDCTVDDCVDGTCSNTPDDTLCESDNPCIENELCDLDNGDPQTGCTAGNEIMCPPSTEPCMEAICDPDDGECKDQLIDGADDDEDTFLDSSCGGDDCNDTSDEAYPGAPEICNYGDDDCDGLTDVVAVIAPMTVQSGPSLHLPAVAHDGADFAVVWQESEGSDGAVYVRVVGSGGELVTDPVNITSEGGDGTFGLEPDVTLGSGEFLATWVSQLGSDDPDAVLIGLTVDSTTVTPSGPALFLETGAATSLASPRVVFDDAVAGSGWIAAWTAGYSDSSGSVELQAEDMHSHPTATFTASTWTGSAAGMSLALIDENDYVLAWSRDDDGSDGDSEVFASRVVLAVDQWDQPGYPIAISTASDVATDPSTEPTVAADGTGNFAVAYTNVPATSATSDILGWTGLGEVALVVDDASTVLGPGLAFDGTDYALTYIFDVGTAMALDFRLLDGALIAYPDQGGRLALAGAGEAVREADLIPAETSGYAAVWIASDGTTDEVVFAAFEGCTSP
jgi:hypothetical protein